MIEVAAGVEADMEEGGANALKIYADCMDCIGHASKPFDQMHSFYQAKSRFVSL